MPYSGLGYDAVVYEGILFESPQATGGGPQSNVVDIDDNRGRLGCGRPDFFITSRCTSGLSCVLTEYVTSATWTRVLDEVSEAEVTVNFSGTDTFTCCECLAETEPWCHELHIWRDGEEVWVGPILEIEYSFEQVVIRAQDSLAWLSVRIPEGNIDYVGMPTDLSEIAEDVLIVAFAEDSPTWTCEIDSLFKVDTGEVTERFFEGYNEPSLNILLDLVDQGLNVTTIGRTIVLSGDDTPLTPLILLNDDHIFGDIVVRKDGSQQGNRYFVHFEGDGGIPSCSEFTEAGFAQACGVGTEEFYCSSAIERIRDGDGLTNQSDAQDLANIYVNASHIAPRIVEIGAGSQLSPETPWTINQMVCGARVDVAITRLCLNLTQSFILTGVEANYDAGEEKIGVTLSPINSIEG